MLTLLASILNQIIIYIYLFIMITLNDNVDLLHSHLYFYEIYTWSVW